jgi:hypothetical protein
MAGMTWRTLRIAADGTLVSTPSKMHAETGDGIAWFVENESGVRVKVRIKDFHKKSTGNPLNAVTFLQDRCTVDAGDPLPGIIMGQVTFVPSRAGQSVLTKYTIEVKSSLFNHDYDPDLEIERP